MCGRVVENRWNAWHDVERVSQRLNWVIFYTYQTAERVYKCAAVDLAVAMAIITELINYRNGHFQLEVSDKSIASIFVNVYR